MYIHVMLLLRVAAEVRSENFSRAGLGERARLQKRTMHEIM